jgi:hypothetical protein
MADITFSTLIPQRGESFETTLQRMAIALALTVSAPSAANGSDVASDTVDLVHPTRAIYISADGDLKVDMVGGADGITFAGLKAGQTMQIQAERIYVTGTTATVIALW